MAVLADVTDAVPGGWDRGPAQRIAAIAAAEKPPEQRAWRLWLEAQWAKNAGAFQLAHQALDAAERVAEEMPWTPTWGLEIRGLRGKLHHDGGEPGRAYDPLTWAMQGWLHLGRALDDPAGAADFVQAALAGAHAMVAAAVDAGYLERLARDTAGTTFEVAAALWLEDRVPTEAREVITRAVNLTAQVRSFTEGRRVANDALAVTRAWRMPWWEPVRFEIGLRVTLASAAGHEQQFAAALGQADDGLVLTGRLPAGPERDRLTAELRANRGGALLGLERPAEAVTEFDRASDGLRALGATTDALRTATAALRARESAGESVSGAAVARLITDMEAAEQAAGGDGRLMADLEFARRWRLSHLAEEGTDDIQAVIGIIEVLRDDQPVLRTGGRHTDPVVTRVSRPFTVLGARLRKLPDTTLVVIEPGLGGVHERAPVFLVVSSHGADEPLRWHLVPSGASAVAMRDLGRRAVAERESLLTGEVSLRSAPSATLTKAATTAWTALPREVREAISSARTVIYLPSGGASLDTIPFELLRHEDGWLGTTHAVVRCPSFQYLETLLAPNAKQPADDTRALVASVAQDPVLGLLADAESEVDLAARAATLLGLEPERLVLDDPGTVLDAFTGRALVHYVGHGFANPIGELLPLSGDRGLSASELPESDGGRAPFTFFNACLLGRVRHLPGGRQRGWALRLLERGAPAVVGALATVPDSACVPVAEAFYAAAWKAPVGEAMRRARVRLHETGLHPLVWAAYVLHGDPHAGISVHAAGSTVDRVRGWPALTTRLLATDLPRYRTELLAAPGVPDVIRHWALGGAAADDDLAVAVDRLLDDDPEGAAVCRILLALARLERDPDNGDELDIGYLCADALQDGYGILHVLGVHAEAWKRRYPGGYDAFLGAARWWLTALAGDRAALADLEAGLIGIGGPPT